MLRKIAESPYLNLLSGLILITTAGYETFNTLDEFHLGAHHGVLVLGIIQVFQTIPNLMHGIKDVKASGYIN